MSPSRSSSGCAGLRMPRSSNGIRGTCCGQRAPAPNCGSRDKLRGAGQTAMQAASPQCMHAMETYWTGVAESSLFSSTTCLEPRATGARLFLHAGAAVVGRLARDLASEALGAPLDVEMECVLHGYLAPFLLVILNSAGTHRVVGLAGDRVELRRRFPRRVYSWRLSTRRARRASHA